MRAYRIAVTRPFITNPDEQTFHPYLIEIPIVMMTLCVLGSYKVEYHKLHKKMKRYRKKYLLWIQNMNLIFLVTTHFQGYVFFYVCVCRSLANGFSEWNKKAQDIFSFRGSGHYYFDQKRCSIDTINYPCSLNHLGTNHFLL